MAEVWSSEMPPRLKLPALALADMADDDGRCWPSVATLCKKTGQSERTMQAAIAELEACNALRRDGRPGRSNVYIITPATFAPPQSLPTTPATLAPPPPQELPTTPATFAPRIVKEPSIEPSRIGAGPTESALALTPPPRDQKKKPKLNGHTYGFDRDAKRFIGVNDADKLRWQEAYHLISVPDELARLEIWLAENYRGQNVGKFIVRNLARAQDREGRKQEARELRR